jgi:hypothetical protein
MNYRKEFVVHHCYCARKESGENFIIPIVITVVHKVGLTPSTPQFSGNSSSNGHAAVGNWVSCIRFGYVRSSFNNISTRISGFGAIRK